MSILYDLLQTMIGKINSCVKTTGQTLSTEQQAQARMNIGAQGKLTGQAGQVVGFDAEGNAQAQEAPSGGGASSWNDIGIKNGVIYEGESLDITPDGFVLEMSGAVEEGAMLSVEIDGIGYNTSVRKIYEQLWAGNGAMFGLEDTGEPFVVLFYDNLTAAIAMLAPDGNLHSLKITGEYISKIPDKYYTTYTKYYAGQTGDAVYYLHKDPSEMPEARVTLSELISAVWAKPIIISIGDSYLYTPLSMLIIGDWAEVNVMHYNSNQIVTYRTAEYVPPETTT